MFIAHAGSSLLLRFLSSCCGPFSLVAVHGLLTAVASLVVEHWLQGTMGISSCDSGLKSPGSVVVAHRLSCSAACRIFPDQGLNPCPLHWQADSLSPSHQGSPEMEALSVIQQRPYREPEHLGAEFCTQACGNP